MSDMSPELEAEAGAELVEEGVAEEVEPEVKDEAITGYIDFRVTINPDTGSVTEVKLATDQIHLWSHDLLVQTVPAKDVIDAVKAKLAE